MQEAWQLQIDRAFRAGAMDGLRVRLATCFATCLAECLDADLKPPTDAQVRYATSITREMGLSLNSEVFGYCGAMAEFLS